MSDEGWVMVRESSAIGVDAGDNEGQVEGGRGRSTGAAQTKRSEARQRQGHAVWLSGKHEWLNGWAGLGLAWLGEK